MDIALISFEWMCETCVWFPCLDDFVLFVFFDSLMFIKKNDVNGNIDIDMDIDYDFKKGLEEEQS